MEINLKKSKVILVDIRSKLFFFYKELELEQVKSYKYLGIDFSYDYSWPLCVQKNVETGFKGLYSLLNKCKRAYLVSWSLKKFLLRSLVFSVILYRTQVWGTDSKKIGW